MPKRTVGQEQDDAAFEEWWASTWREHGTASATRGQYITARHIGRLGFDASMRRQKERGCCQEERDG